MPFHQLVITLVCCGLACVSLHCRVSIDNTCCIDHLCTRANRACITHERWPIIGCSPAVCFLCCVLAASGGRQVRQPVSAAIAFARPPTAALFAGASSTLTSCALQTLSRATRSCRTTMKWWNGLWLNEVSCCRNPLLQRRQLQWPVGLSHGCCRGVVSVCRASPSTWSTSSRSTCTPSELRPFAALSVALP